MKRNQLTYGIGCALLLAAMAWAVQRPASAGAPAAATTSFRFLTSTMPDASTNTFYDVQLQVAGAAGAATFSVSAGGLPPGMALDPKTGYVSGRPTVVNGSGYPVTFTATDGVSTINLAASIKVSATGGGGNEGVTFTISSLPQGKVGDAYSTTVTVTSGIGPFIFGADGLPPGLSLAGTTGIISGTPAAAGTFFVILSVTDNGDPNLNKVFFVLPLLVVPADGSNFQFTTVILTGGEVGTPYSLTVQTANAPKAVSYAATGLPPGLTIDAGTGQISGTPQAGSAGTYLASITATSGSVTISLHGAMVIAGSSTSNFIWNYSGLPSALAGVEYGRQPPLVVNTLNPGPGPGVSYSALGLPAGISYNGNTGELSGVATDPGNYPVTFAATDSGSNQTIKLGTDFIVLPPSGGDTNNLAVNFWAVKQSIKEASVAGTYSWQGQYIYNANRTASKIFNPGQEALIIRLSSIAPIQFIPPPTATTYSLSGSKGKFSFKTPKPAGGVTTNANVALKLDESAETIKFTARNGEDTQPSTNTGSTGPLSPVQAPPGWRTYTNTLVIGSRSYKVDEAFFEGVFTPALGYEKAAFVVASAKLAAKTPLKDAAQYQMLLAVPAFAYPPPSGDKTIRLRVLNGTTVLIDKTLSPSTGTPTLVAATSGVDKKTGQPVMKFKGLKDPAATNTLAKFSYDSGSGKLQLALKNLTLSGSNLLDPTSTSGVHTGVELTFGDKVYFTGVTIFAPKAGSYSTKLP